jgi:hypothetical protein
MASRVKPWESTMPYAFIARSRCMRTGSRTARRKRIKVMITKVMAIPKRVKYSRMTASQTKNRTSWLFVGMQDDDVPSHDAPTIAHA